MVDWQEIRSRYPVLSSCTYLDSARTGAISIGTTNTWREYIDDQLQNGTLHREQWEESVEKTRRLVADVFKTSPSDIAFISDVQSGVRLLAGLMDRNSRIALIDHDFPSITEPWIQNSFDVKWIPREKDLTIDFNKIEEAVKSGCEVLCVSWVHYNSGFRIDLDALGQLCKEHKTKLIVDGTQGVCVLPISLGALKIDAFLASGFKWMSAGFGVGIAYINPELRTSLGFENKNALKMVEQSHPKFQGILGLKSALTELNEIGFENIQEKTAHLSIYLQEQLVKAGVDILSDFSDENSSSIRLIRGNQELFEKLAKANIRVTFRDDHLRIAPHFYNDERDIDKLIAMLID